MTRFDADSSHGSPVDSSFTSARATVALHPGIVVLSTVLAGLATTIACCLLFAGQGARYQLTRAIDAIQLSVYLQPQASRADAEGLRGPIEATPNVADARLRTREDALTAFKADDLQGLTTKTNPLPDVWIVKVRRPSGDPDDRSLSARIANTRLALAALPGVDSVRADDRWLDVLDRSASWLGRAMTIGSWAISATLLASLFGLFFLAGRALSASGRLGRDRMQALATVGMCSGLASLCLAGGLLVILATWIPELDMAWKPILDSIGRNGHVFVVGMGLAIILFSALGHAFGGSER